MPSRSLHRLHRPRRSGRTGLRLLATLIVALALAEPAAAESFGAEEVQEMNSMMAQEGVQMPPEVTVPEVPMDASVPVEAVPVEVPPVEPAPAEAAPPPPAPAAVEPHPAPAPEPAPAEPAEPSAVEAAPPAVPAEPPEPSAKPPDPPAPPPAPLGAGEIEPVDVDPEALLEQVTELPPAPEEVSAEPPSALSDMADPKLPEEIEQIVPVVPVNLNVDIRIFSPGNDGDVNQFVDIPVMPTGGSGAPGALDGSNGLDLGLDWTWNWTWVWQCGGASTAGMNWNWNWTWDDACLPQDLGSELLDDRPTEGHLDGLLEALAPEGTSLAEAIDRVDNPFEPKSPAKHARDTRPQAHVSKPSKTHHGGAVPLSVPGPPPPSFGDGGLPALALSPSSGAEGDQPRAAIPAGGAAGPKPARDPADNSPQSLAMAGLAPSGGGGGGGGGGLFFFLAALLGALALVPLLAGGRVQTLHRKLSSLLSSSRLERPG